MAKTYSEAGVDIEKGDRFARFIGSLPSSAVSKGIGGFAGGFELPPGKYRHPVILSSTDGVGTKLMVAGALKKYDTLGIDLVAMCVNDLIVCGAEPVSFLDYIGCGRLDEAQMQAVIRGIVARCEQAECQLSGGETAEMPDMYPEGEFDLAGFAIGVAEKSSLLPRLESVTAGDRLYGLPSVGIHSNGLSLARKVVPADDIDLMNELLTPTKIYVKEMKRLLEPDLVKAAAHITGGGLEGNVERVIPNGRRADFTWDWPVPEVFDRIQAAGGIDTEEMRKVFNMGLGMVLVVGESDASALEVVAREANIELLPVGTVV